jgi:tetraprenyl-beta-curcumene synthase
MPAKAPVSTPTGTSNGHAPVGGPARLRLLDREHAQASEPVPDAGYEPIEAPRRSALPETHAALALAGASGCYLAFVLPAARGQIRAFQVRAQRIADLRLRELALSALEKRGNIEGAALFATLAPAEHRDATVRALVAFQSAYNYTDALSEQPSADPGANAEQCHQALLIALHPDAPHPDYYAHDQSGGSDGGFLAALVDACRRALSELPQRQLLAAHAREAAARIVDFQTLNRRHADGGHRALQGWARELGDGHEVCWWETAAGAGSSLAVHALVAAAADQRTGAHELAAIDAAYFPWVGALHSLLDAIVDQEEDARAGQPSLLDPYGSPYHALAGVCRLAARSLQECERLPDGARHRAILTAMCSYYLSAPQAGDPLACSVRAGLNSLLGSPLLAARALFSARRLAHTLARRPYL